MDKGKICKVTIEYQNVTYIAEGEDAERKWAHIKEHSKHAKGSSKAI